MFDKLKKAFSRDGNDAAETSGSELAATVSRWASAQGFTVVRQTPGQGLALQGRVAGNPWRMEIGKPTREFIVGEELRARAELGLNEDVALLIINRPLKESLERKAYSMITDSLHTTADPNLPEEMRWLSMYDEVGWDSLPSEFWRRYSVLADRREHALAWIDPPLAKLLLEWPQPGRSAEAAFLLMLLRGKAYLRMEYVPAETATLQHAADIFTNACEAALSFRA